MASTSGTQMSSLQTPIFSGKIYEYCSITMKALFRVQDVWHIVQNGYIEPANRVTYNNLAQDYKYSLKQQRKTDENAMFYIHQARNENILTIMEVAKTSKKARNTLETNYQG